MTATTRASPKTPASAASGNGNGAKQTAAMAPAERDAIETKYRDFFWTYTEEPHRTRRLAIIKAHPEVRFTSPPPNPTIESARLTEFSLLFRSLSSAAPNPLRNTSSPVSSLCSSCLHTSCETRLSGHGSSGPSPTFLAPRPTRTSSSPSTRSHTISPFARPWPTGYSPSLPTYPLPCRTAHHSGYG